MALISTEFFDANTAAQQTHTFAATCPAGAKAVVAFWWRGYTSDNRPAVDAMTFGGQAMTLAGETDLSVNHGGGVRYLNNPPVGAQNWFIDFSLNMTRVGLILAYFDQNVTLSNYLALAAGGDGTITSASGETAYMVVSDANGATLAPDVGTTEVVEYSPVNYVLRYGLYSKPGAASVAVETVVTNPNDTQRWGISILEAAAGFAAEWVLTR